MPEIVVRLCSQEGFDAEGRFQSHQWAELPAELAGTYMSGGLKKVRRLAEQYFSFRFSQAQRRIQGRWRSGEPHLSLRFFRVPGVHGRLLVHLGRLRSTGTRDVYRGYLEVRGGDSVSPAAVLEGRPWPEDIPWVSPSAGEYLDSEKSKSSYLGIFEFRVERSVQGCVLHTLLVDFPPAESGLGARLWTKPWQPLRRSTNLAYLRREIEASAKQIGCPVRFEEEDHPGVPARPAFRFGNSQTAGV